MIFGFGWNIFRKGFTSSLPFPTLVLNALGRIILFFFACNVVGCNKKLCNQCKKQRHPFLCVEQARTCRKKSIGVSKKQYEVFSDSVKSWSLCFVFSMGQEISGLQSLKIKKNEGKQAKQQSGFTESNADTQWVILLEELGVVVMIDAWKRRQRELWLLL